MIDEQSKDRMNRLVPSIHWYSQTLGKGRGLEDLVAALPVVQHEVEIHLRGKPAPDFHNWLAAQLPDRWRRHVFVHDLVPADDLLSRIAEHDIGFAGEQKYCKSRDLTVTNKILHYLLAGLAVIASDTIGQQEVAQKSGAGVRLYRAGDPVDLATQLNWLIADKQRLMEAKSAALRAAEQTFCWEREAPKLIATVEAALTKA
jgi:glycosyltransferase involved in cell wall biosynthesis